MPVPVNRQENHDHFVIAKNNFVLKASEHTGVEIMPSLVQCLVMFGSDKLKNTCLSLSTGKKIRDNFRILFE